MTMKLILKMYETTFNMTFLHMAKILFVKNNCFKNLLVFYTVAYIFNDKAKFGYVLSTHINRYRPTPSDLICQQADCSQQSQPMLG